MAIGQPRPRLIWITTLLSAAALSIVAATRVPDQPEPPRALGLFTSLPLLWPESTGVVDTLRLDSPPHWALAAMRLRSGKVVPLDSLASLPPDLDALIMAQPRPLAPDENVALDRWVRGGGRLLLFADPMLTRQSAFALGDRRRPQDIVMLSPILGRWGLTLWFDPDQAGGERQVAVLGESVPVDLPGRLMLRSGARECVLLARGLVARCRIGAGAVVIVADAALFDAPSAVQATANSAVFDALMGAAFSHP